MKPKRSIIAAAAAILGLAAWVSVTQTRPGGEPPAPEFDDVSAFGKGEIARVDTWLREQVELSKFPSLSVAVVRQGKIVYQGAFGFEDVKAGRRATTNTLHHVASVTKAFTASLAVLLHGRGVVDLDQQVAAYLPKDVSISATPELGAKITLRQLASHTSGLPRDAPGPVQSVEGRYQLEPELFHKQLAKARLEFNPGAGELYSNLGFGLLGHALERASGKSYEELLRDLICGPLNMEGTAIHVGGGVHVATGYATRLRLPATYSRRERFASSGGLVTTAGDLATFLSAQMKPGLFTSGMLEQMHGVAKLADGSAAARALGWSVESGNPAGRVLSKNGGRSNCGAWIGFSPEHGVGVAVVTNCGEPSVDSIGRWLLERSIPGGARPASKHGFAKVAPYTGVRWEDGLPIVQVQGRWARLVSIDGIPMDRILEFARSEFGDRARKRFAEDLVELLSRMGHDPQWTVTLGLESKDGQVEHLPVRMTEANRKLARE